MLSEDTGSGTTAEAASNVDDPDATVRCLDDQADAWFDARGQDNDEHFLGSLDAAIDHILASHAEDGARTDRKVEDLNKWAFGMHEFACVYRSEPKDGVGFPDGDGPLYLRHTAFGHLCERSKAPSKYLRSIPLRYTIPALNWGIKKKSDGPALIRLAGDDEVRAILSARYAALDDCTVLPQLRTSLNAANLLGSIMARVVATGRTTLMRLSINGDAISIAGTDEIAEIAIDVTNGEVGNRALALSPCVYLRNKRIATRRANLRLRHIGASDRLAEEFRRAIPEVLAEARKLRSQIATAVDRAISDIVAEAEKLQVLGLTISEARDVLRKLAKDTGVELPHDTAEWEAPLGTVSNIRAYDVFVAVAGLGEGRATDRRLELEEAAAKYLARATK